MRFISVFYNGIFLITHNSHDGKNQSGITKVIRIFSLNK